MTVVEAVRSLQMGGGRIRRTSWRPDEYVTSGPTYYFFYHFGVDHMARSVRACPMANDILADDWTWEAPRS